MTRLRVNAYEARDKMIVPVVYTATTVEVDARAENGRFTCRQMWLMVFQVRIIARFQVSGFEKDSTIAMELLRSECRQI